MSLNFTVQAIDELRVICFVIPISLLICIELLPGLAFPIVADTTLIHSPYIISGNVIVVLY